jgi:hypothetical protein
VRNHSNWLKAYLDYSRHSEAPAKMRFWAGVSAVAGALQRKVWIDQAYFKWYANFYICFVAPPGVVSKSTTSGVAMQLLRQVPGVQFGPDIVTWQSLVTSFAGAKTAFEYPTGAWNEQSALTLEASEFGNLLNPQDREMVDLFVTLWDGKQGALRKETKMSGNDVVINPWINMIACTTPAWIAGSFPEYMIGGGFTSRCIFIFANQKQQLIAYPSQHVEQLSLVADLVQISKISGEYRLTPEAIAWGTEWYQRHVTTPNPELANERFGGYLARKQTHIHKLAMVIAAAQHSQLVITAEDLANAYTVVTDLESDMMQVFARIGKSATASNTEQLLAFIRQKGEVEWDKAYMHVHSFFPSLRVYEDVLFGLVKSKQVVMVQQPGKVVLRAVVPQRSPAEER